MQAKGPYPPKGEEPEPDVPLALITKQADDKFTGLAFDMGELVDLIRPFNGRARTFLISLLRGASRTMASSAAGVDVDTVREWERKHPEFARASKRCSNLGFTNVFESELYRRALAGPDDRGSMRALELVAKSRDSAYRDKSQVQMEHVLRAGEAMQRLMGGWETAGTFEGEVVEP